MRIDDIDLHFIHEPRASDAPPLLLSHGWPGSVFEFHKLIPLLTEHFTVVAPSLPGYTLSFKPGQKRFGVEEIAALFTELMTDDSATKLWRAGRRLGLFITSVLGHRYTAARRRHPPQHAAGAARSATLSAPTRKKATSTQLETFLKEETGYQWIQGTRAADAGLRAAPIHQPGSPPGWSRNSAPGPTATATRRMP